MMQIVRRTFAAFAVVLACSAFATANEWNERTELTFSEPILVPGATLQPGTYVFKLADSSSARHIVQVYTKDQDKLVTTTQAVPTRRPDPKGDIVLKFNPTDSGTPPAMKAWFYPGSTYGHEFIYPESEARKIAERTKTVVLSIDVDGTDLEQGTLTTLNAAGARAAWKGDADATANWDRWQKNRARTSAAAGQATDPKPQTTDADERKEASATMVSGGAQAMKIDLDDLEDHPDTYIGQTISVDAKVEEVYGPRLFTIDEPNWGDLAGEVLVFMPTHLAALVREDDRLTITGKVQRFVKADVEREWGWFGFADEELEVEFSRKPVLVAERLVGGGNDFAMVIETGDTSDRAVGTTGSAAASGSPMLTDISEVDENDELVGRRVTLKNAQVAGLAKGGGFFLKSGADTPDKEQVFVLPANASSAASIKAGDSVAITGVILQMPDGMEDRLEAPGDLNDEIYLYATTIKR